jgi:hypothetical protein
VVSDFFKGEPGIDQSAGAGVPKGMRSTAFPRSHHGQKTAAHKIVKSSRREGSERGVEGHKYRATVAFRPSLTQVTSQGIPHVSLQRQRLSSPTLGSHHTEAIFFPIDVVEPKTPNLARAQAVNGEQKKDGPIA